MRSPNSRGPIGWLAPSFIAVSIPLASATPSAKIPIPSLIIGIRILFTTKPGASATSTGVFPNASVRARIVALVSSDVVNPLMISTSFIAGTGLKKCIPITLSGLPVAAAISVMERDEVFVAMMVSGLQSLSNSANRAFLASISSVAASITKSASAMMFMSVEPVILPKTSAAASAVILSLATILSRFFLTVARPFSTEDSLLALITTS